MIAAERLFLSREDLADELARDVADALRKSIAANGAATLAVSGGATPKLFFSNLARRKLEWWKVTVTLVDERQVPEKSERSNARLVKNSLVKHGALAARFIPLYGNPAASSVPRFTAVILGMGNDGHTASFFPGGDTLAEATNPKTKKRIVAISAPGSGEPRLTFTLPVLLDTDFLALHIEGREKRKVLDAALADGPMEAMPIRAILRSDKPVTLYWCP
ncbi:MAG: 6-phosphogluconolactonase [Rhizobiales bacterium]|nr:6-phosphogluconolactonase [Hyphomicrobiales bacterium]